MIKRINRTRRRRIERRNIDLKLRVAERGEAPIFDLALDLSEYDFPPDSPVRLEAWRGNSVQRWDYGCAGMLSPPPENERRLTDVPAGAQFRLFVVADNGSGLLLGHAPNVRPVLPLDSRLPLEESDQLGEEVWRIEFDSDDGNPVLVVNSAIPGISDAVRHDPTFRALVMPEVFRAILTRMVLVDRADAEDEDGQWADWFAIACAYHRDMEPPALGPAAPIEEVEDARTWIDAVVGALAKHPLKAANSYAEARA